ncbi:PD-(D/E)XK nuclease family protein [Mucilaginibacter arboris]|uniref:PD-(D/E)XK nuclease family protein n=1 Tax=Mucilaginibacter arboris TaxID=2682090 RepID=A0A7K1SZT0_9SPHI|nr:PD-(D/E)XK nuclease family protein [Mucilaginibacter arboris]MVN22816.1 PD-(D/E)XK nuclease family protein [Mucilaginibacter arboris]
MVPFLHDVAADLIARLGEGLKQTAIIFNNKRPEAFLKKHLGALQGNASFSPAFFTISSFFAVSTNLVVADQLKQFFILHQEFNKLLIAEGKPTLSPDQFFPMANIILSDFAEVDYDLVNAEALFTQLEDIAEIQQQFSHFTEEQQQFLERFWSSFSADKQRTHQQKFLELWKRMPTLYRNFHQALQGQGLITSAQTYRCLAEGKADFPDFISPYQKLIFIGFNALNKCEEKLFKQWQEQGRALFYFDTDDYYLQDELQEAGFFLRRNIFKSGLVNSFSGRSFLGDKRSMVEVIKTQGHAAQAKILTERIDFEALADFADDPEKTAIILSDESLLVPVMQTLPPEAGMVNITMGYPLTQSPLFGLTELWLKIQEQINKQQKHTVYYRDALAFLSHPLSGVKAAEREALQNKLLTNQWVEVPLTELHLISALAPNFFTSRHNGLQTIDALYLMLTAVLEQRQRQNQLNELEANLILEACKKLNLLYDNLDQYAPSLGLSLVFALIRKTLASLAVPLEGEPLRGIQVMGMLESRCLDFEHVIILGMNEGTMPKRNVNPSFIPDSLRRANGLPVLENQDAIAAYLFYRLLQRSEKVTLVYDGLGGETEAAEPSRFIRQLAYESKLKFNYLQQEQPVKIEPSNVIIITKKEKVWKAMEGFFYNGNPFKTNNISATALTTYLTCTLQFFFRYVAQIKEPEEVAENLEANQIGSALHQALEWFYANLIKTDTIITAERISEKLTEVPEYARAALSMVLFNNRTQLKQPNSMQQIVLQIVGEYMKAILEHDRSLSPFQIVELENKKDYKYHFPIQINGQKKYLQLYGILDRVDEKDGQTRIVDYKTGSDELKYSSLEKLFERDGKAQNKAVVQTLFYTYIYEQVKRTNNVEPNLYAVRKMKEEGTRFKSGKTILQSVDLEDAKVAFTGYLQNTLDGMFDQAIPFLQTTRLETCQYCPYKDICER